MATCIPSGIRMSRTCLLMPTFEELGLPVHVMALATIRVLPARAGEHAFDRMKLGKAPGYWVKRGEPLLEYRYTKYERASKPSFPLSVVASDTTSDIIATVPSPVDGLIINLRNEWQRVDQPWGVAYQLHEAALPVLLMPDKEPPANNSSLSEFERLARTLSDCVDRLQKFDRVDGGRDVRLSTAREHYGPVAKDMEVIKQFTRLNFDAFWTRQWDQADREWVQVVQWLRGEDYSLRNSLEHLADGAVMATE